MRYQLRQKFFSLGDDYSICDERGDERFFVDGRAFSIGDRLTLQDANRTPLLEIRQRLLSWGPTYEIARSDGSVAAMVKKQLFTLFNCKFFVDVPGPDDLEATGNFLDMEYALARNGTPVAQVSKRWFAMTDTYGVDISDGEDDALIVASAVVIDLCCHPDQKRG